MNGIYYIIDKAKTMHVQPADSKQQAMELFDDKHQVRHDVVIEGRRCGICGNKIPRPLTPDWLVYTMHTQLHAQLCNHNISVEV